MVRDQDWQKHDIAAGAMGASIVELTGMIALELKGVTAGELSEADKQTVSALATLASTLAGGLIGNSSECRTGREECG